MKSIQWHRSFLAISKPFTVLGLQLNFQFFEYLGHRERQYRSINIFYYFFFLLLPGFLWNQICVETSKPERITNKNVAGLKPGSKQPVSLTRMAGSISFQFLTLPMKNLTRSFTKRYTLKRRESRIYEIVLKKVTSPLWMPQNGVGDNYKLKNLLTPVTCQVT